MFIIQKLFIEHLLYLCTFLDVDAILVNKTEKNPTLNGIYLHGNFPCLYVYIILFFFTILTIF